MLESRGVNQTATWPYNALTGKSGDLVRGGPYMDPILEKQRVVLEDFSVNH
jgi:hypothetical protein